MKRTLTHRLLIAVVLACVLPLAASVAAALGADDDVANAAADRPANAAERAAQQVAFFESKVRPVLVEHCHGCHSHGAKKLKAGLYLDSRAGLLKGGDTGAAIVPGDAAKSLLVTAVSYEDVFLQMPPKKKLPAGAIEDLRKWVELGAPWPKGDEPGGPAKIDEFDIEQRKASHWAWRPVADVKPPAVRDESWPINAIDRFILAKLEDKGLRPASPAEKRALIRRVTFDLIGLPPTPEEVRAFVNDESPDAYEKVVDRLLRSPHFGEKWARHWMDLARYSETYGHEFDYPIPHAWRYRDYLIRAFNDDVPYDQFVTEHIAGDLLDKPRINESEGWNESVIGTSFWWFGEATHAPVDVRGDEAGRIDNQIDVFSRTFLGLTIACARCHDHKFDAISTKDYYALAGFLQSSRRHEALLDPHGRIADLTSQIKAERGKVESLMRETLARGGNATADSVKRALLAARAVTAENVSREEAAAMFDVSVDQVNAVLKSLEAKDVEQPTHPLFAFSKLAARKDATAGEAFAAHREQLALLLNGQKTRAEARSAERPIVGEFNGETYGQWFADGPAFGDAPTQPGQWNGSADKPRLVAPDQAHSGLVANKLRGVLRSPTFELTHDRVLVRLNADHVEVRLVIDGYFMQHYNGLLFGGTRHDNVDTKGEFQWLTIAGDTHRYRGHTAWLEITDDDDGHAIVDEVRLSNDGPPPDAPSDVAVKLAGDKGIDSVDALAVKYGELIAHAAKRIGDGKADALSADDVMLLNWAIAHGLIAAPPTETLAAHTKRIDDLSKQIPNPAHVLAITDGSSEHERVFIRGKHNSLGDIARRRLLEALYPQPIEPDRGSGRLELARRVVDPDNPFTSRVMVNRLWHHLFGRGIVPTVDDFGEMGQPPTHPQLLDFLSRDFVRNGWSIKRAIRQMVLSQTYRMSSSSPAAPSTSQAAQANPKSAIPNPKSTDPANDLLHRARIRRLPAESIRDSILAVSGRLDRKVGGPSVKVHLTPFMEGRGRPGSGPLDGNGRRSLYIEVRRNFLPPMLLAFDFPAPFSAMGRRTVSNVPAQALIMMNDPFVVQQAQLWAKRTIGEAKDADSRLTLMFETAFARPPTDMERASLKAYIAEQAAAYNSSTDDERVWRDVAHVVLNMKEFLFLR